MRASELAALDAALADLLRDKADPLGTGYDAALWTTLAQSGLTTVGLPEGAGGSGGTIAAAVRVARAEGAFAARVPLADSALVAGWLLTTAGFELPEGPCAAGVLVDGVARRVAYASESARLVLLTEDGRVVSAAPGEVSITPGRNVADEPRDDVAIEGVDGVAVGASVVAELRLRAALARSAQIAGALGAVQRATVTYALQRSQFGRPIATFQAVQHEIATLVCEVTAADAAVSGAVRCWESQGPDATPTVFAVAAAKVRTAQAASLAATIAHQVHGALGMTQEHALHAWTTRLWSWRAEWGGESSWAARLGALAVDAGPEGTWPLVVAAG